MPRVSKKAKKNVKSEKKQEASIEVPQVWK